MRPILLPIPHRVQHEDGECLVACALMALAHIDISIPYQRLSNLLQTKKQLGTPASNVLKLRQLGIKVVYEQGTLNKLYSYLAHNRPCIAFVKTIELPYWDQVTDHAVVVVGIDNEFVYLNDPVSPTAPIQVSHGDFELAWQEWDELYAVLAP